MLLGDESHAVPDVVAENGVVGKDRSRIVLRSKEEDVGSGMLVELFPGSLC